MEIEFRDGHVDRGDGGALLQALRAELAQLYDGLDVDDPAMPRAGAAELGPPGGAFLVGYSEATPICCGGIKRLPDGACEIKRMYVAPAVRGRGVARQLLHALERRAVELGYTVARLDTGPRQPHARALYESEGYAPISNFNANPIATFFGERRLSRPPAA